jgi:hypothetical protein
MKNITVWNEQNAWAFTELIETIKDAILQYGGFDVKVNYGILTNPNDFIIQLHGKGIPVPRSEISVLVESDHIDLPLRKRAPLDYTKWTRSLHFFDYKRDLKDQNIHFLQLGYSKHFDTDIPRQDLRNTFHFGRGGDRPKFRNEYKLWHPTTKVPIGRERDEYIVTSRININSRKEEDYRFTPLHAALVVHKGKLYFEEDYGLDDYGFFKDYLILYTMENFREKLDHWSRNEKERHESNVLEKREVFTYGTTISYNNKFENIK